VIGLRNKLSEKNSFYGFKINISARMQQVQQPANNVENIDNNDEEGLIDLHDLYLRQS
jgi:hypothetical protein